MGHKQYEALTILLETKLSKPAHLFLNGVFMPATKRILMLNCQFTYLIISIDTRHGGIQKHHCMISHLEIVLFDVDKTCFLHGLPLGAVIDDGKTEP